MTGRKSRPSGKPRGLVASGGALVASVLIAACAGELVGGAAPQGNRPPGNGPDPGGGQGEAPVSFSCEPARKTTEPGWRRLTKRQYERTLRDFLAYALGDEASALAVYGALESTLTQLPDDQRMRLPQDLHGSYRRLDQAVDQVHVDQWYHVAVAVGAELATEDWLGVVLGYCGDAAGSAEACVRPLVERLGERALRRPLSEAEVEFHLGFYGDEAALAASSVDPAGVADVIAGLLTAPQFLYHIEHGAEPTGDAKGSVALTAYELAARLSYHFWDTMPDDQLLAAARNGSLLERAEFERQVDRLVEHRRANETAREFFRDWLKLEDLPLLDRAVGQPVFDAFAGDDLPSPQLRESMINEVLDLLDHLVFKEPGGTHELFTTDLAFPKTEALASLYGVEPSGSEPITLPAGQRPGLLTRAAFLATGSATTRPILKGVFIRTNILCDVIPAPPNNANNSLPELSDTLSTRQLVEALTEAPETNCALCHVSYINPLGFATEAFDALGRLRSEQTLFDTGGNAIGSAPVDTSTQVQIGSSLVDVSGPDDLMDALVESGKLEACLARHYFRYSFGRWEDLRADGCLLEEMRQLLVETGSLSGMLKAVALTDEFSRRIFE